MSRSLGFRGDGKLTEDRDIFEQMGFRECYFGHVGSEPFMWEDIVCGGPSKAIRRPLVEKLGIDREFKLFTRQDC